MKPKRSVRQAEIAGPFQPEFFEPAKAAFYCSRSRSWLDKQKQAGNIPFYRISRRNILFRRSDLDAFVEQFRVDPGEPTPFENPSRRRGKNGKFSKQEGGRA